MTIDSSALLAILLGEQEAEAIAASIAGHARRLMSAFSLLETGVAVEARKGEAGARELDVLLHKLGVEIVPLTPEQTELARTAWHTYGTGPHAAGLNIGDCCSYALSRYSGEPLLYKGEDFRKTDISSVL